MGFTLVLIALALASVECVDRQKLGNTPPPQKQFDEHKYTGDWYLQARLPPCSWSGSAGFNNYVSQYSSNPTGYLLKDTWRSSDCTTATLKFTRKDLPGGYVAKDPIGTVVSLSICSVNPYSAGTDFMLMQTGNVLSGDSVVVATDYKKFAIKWGCTKTSNAGTCSDPYVVVKTRKRDPSPHTWKVVEALLDHYWNLTLPEMIRIAHDQDACVQFEEPTHQFVPPAGEHLKKMY